MTLTKKSVLFLFNLIFLASLCLGSPNSVLAKVQTQIVDEEVLTPLFPDLTWENSGNVQKSIHVYGRTLTMNGDVFKSIESSENNTDDIFNYYSSETLRPLGWDFTGGVGLELTYQHKSGVYLTVEISKCANSNTNYCVTVWRSTDTVEASPDGAVASAAVAFDKVSPVNGAVVTPPDTTYQFLRWGDAGKDSSDRYQYCVDETNNSSCDTTWITRDSLYSGSTGDGGEFAVVVGHTYYWQVRVRDANIYANNGVWWSFSVQPTVAFSKITPANAVTIPIPSTTYYLLQWSDAEIATTDRYQYCIDETNNSACDTAWITRDSLYSGTGEFAATPGHTYYWQVRARDANIYANSGAWWSFTVSPLATFTKTTPSNGGTIVPPPTTYQLLKWTDAFIAPTDRYQYCIDQTNNSACDTSWITRNSLYSGSDEFTAVVGHTYYWQVRARDANIYTDNGAWWSFTVQQYPAVTSVTRAIPVTQITDAASVSFTVIFNQAVTGVDISDFVLTTTGVSGASITGVSGSGTTYTVTVNTGTRDGTIRLDVADDDTIKAVSNNVPLGGTGVNNGKFTGGQNYIIDKIPSVVSSGPSVASPINLMIVDFTVVFSENVTGVDINDFILTVTGVSGASISSVSGSGSTYIVKVNTGTGNGTIRLDVLNNGSIIDSGAKPLSGIFNTGTVLTINKNVEVYIGGSLVGTYGLGATQSLRDNYTGVDNGPVKLISSGPSVVAAIRDAWAVNGVTTSFSQFMGLPLSQVSDKYVFPAYNNVTLNEQLRIGNVDTVPSTVTVTIGGVLRGTYTLQPNEAVRINYAGLDSGPVIVQGTAGVDIIAAIRDAWSVNGVTKSFVQLMGLPATQLSDQYVFPAYNNVTLNEQLRIGNVDTLSSTVTVTIGGILQGTYTLLPNEAVRVNYAGLDSGPVIVQGTAGVDIIAAIRDAWQVNGVTTSFSQLMGLPSGQLSDQYVFPSYNNVTLNEQLRIGNVDTVPTSVTVTIGGVLKGTYPLLPNEAVRINYAGVDSGPVVVQGTAGVHIISAIRDAWAVNGITQSFIQMMGLPGGQLSGTFLFPAYNNVTLSEQLRFGAP